MYVDTNKGIENLKNQPIKGILKTNEPLPDYDSDYSNRNKKAQPIIPAPDYNSGQLNHRNQTRNNRFEPAPDYDLDEGKNRARDNWNKLIGKFKRAVVPEQYESGKLTEAIADSVQVKVTQQENYLREIGQGKHVHGSAEFNMLRMDSEQLKTCKLLYDKSRQALFDHTGKTASTIGKESKGVQHLQAFVMSKEGEIYIASHKGVYETNRKIPNLSHASFLEGRPAEAAGMILIENGKIGYISDNSGHYQPEEIDMYRGIKKIQEKMSGALDKNCLIHIHGKKPEPVKDFVAKMEIKVRGAGGKTHYELLREDRIARIKEYQARLENVSKKAANAGRTKRANFIG